ncbi:MAG: type III-B CRISPR module RAMP protein Cmr1 [Chloroflexi bacterium]|nr:type III-B CRISPR module RAMP protein Cmr1 [Chloroflexota bacterium]
MPANGSVILTLETVTPLFLGGADPRGAPELRPPAFRGVLRYWLRAAAGGAVGGDVAAVRRAEAAVFGSADASLGGASAVTLRIRHGSLPKPVPYIRQGAMGRDYLYWSMVESGRRERGNYQPPKEFYPPETTFDLELSARPGAATPERSLDQAVAALWLLMHLGGLGSRARRTAGSLSVRGSPTAAGLSFALAAKDVAQAAQQLGAGLRVVRQHFAAPGSAPPRLPPAFDLLHPSACRVWVLGTWPRPDQAVEMIGQAMLTFRARREPDRSQVARWLDGQPIPTVERAVFGLPIPYRYPGGGPSATVQARLGADTLDRRASPLWLKVSRTADGTAVGVATLFASAFLPEGARLSARTRGAPPPIRPPTDYALIEAWVRASFPGAWEVVYA